MSSLPHDHQVYKSKRKPKNPIKFKIQLNEEQKQAKAQILINDITVLKGGAGSGKTLLAVQTALDLLFTKEVEKIIITRPTVSKEDIGFLPGDIKEKMDPWLAPIYQNMYTLYDKKKIDKCIEDGKIEIIPFAFIRGITFVNSLVIVDEAQNVTHDQMEAVIGRLGRDSKLIICGDLSQNDLKYKKDSGFQFLSTLSREIEGFEVIKLLNNHRHRIVKPVLEIYEKYRN
jgi:phosphate starvation-inducible PhoH-like protein